MRRRFQGPPPCAMPLSPGETPSDGLRPARCRRRDGRPGLWAADRACGAPETSVLGPVIPGLVATWPAKYPAQEPLHAVSDPRRLRLPVGRHVEHPDPAGGSPHHPPGRAISKLTPEQAMFHFMSGYTAKVAGTETGVTEPQLTFSACFGKAFLPLHPSRYATLLGEKMKKHEVNVWLVNTGWSGGAYGVGKRMKLSYTRAMISAALNGDLEHNNYKQHHVFKLMMPLNCPGVPNDILDPSKTWDQPGRILF